MKWTGRFAVPFPVTTRRSGVPLGTRHCVRPGRGCAFGCLRVAGGDRVRTSAANARARRTREPREQAPYRSPYRPLRRGPRPAQGPSWASIARRLPRSPYRSVLAPPPRPVRRRCCTQSSAAGGEATASRRRNSRANRHIVQADGRDPEESELGEKRQIEAVRVKCGRVAVGRAHERVEMREVERSDAEKRKAVDDLRSPPAKSRDGCNLRSDRDAR